LYQNGTSVATGTATTGTSSATDPAYSTIGSNYSTGGTGLPLLPWNGAMQEIILYTTDQSANRAAIEADQMGYY
jgi:hypothetical protein